MVSTFVCRVSGGAGSIVALHRTVAKFGVENCIGVFADTGSEHHTTYAAVQHVSIALPDLRFHWLRKDGHDGGIWDFFDKQGFIRSADTGCVASFHLKQKVLDAFSETVPNSIIVTGLDFSEEDRIERLRKKKKGKALYFPLCEKPYLGRCDMVDEIERLGYPKQELYDRGYPHNNCGQHGCVLAGISQWAGFYADDPAGYEYSAMREQQFQKLHDTDFTILKDRRNGQTKSLSLYQLKERIDSGDTEGLQEFRSTCSCMTDGFWQPES